MYLNITLSLNVLYILVYRHFKKLIFETVTRKLTPSVFKISANAFLNLKGASFGLTFLSYLPHQVELVTTVHEKSRD